MRLLRPLRPLAGPSGVRVIELLSLVSILVTVWAVAVLLPAALRTPGLVSLHHAALASVALAVIAGIAGGLYIVSSVTGTQVPLAISQPIRVIALVVATAPAVYWLWAFYCGRFAE